MTAVRLAPDLLLGLLPDRTCSQRGQSVPKEKKIQSVWYSPLCALVGLGWVGCFFGLMQTSVSISSMIVPLRLAVYPVYSCVPCVCALCMPGRGLCDMFFHATKKRNRETGRGRSEPSVVTFHTQCLFFCYPLPSPLSAACHCYSSMSKRTNFWTFSHCASSLLDHTTIPKERRKKNRHRVFPSGRATTPEFLEEKSIPSPKKKSLCKI